jgi:hypothetical protein
MIGESLLRFGDCNKPPEQLPCVPMPFSGKGRMALVGLGRTRRRHAFEQLVDRCLDDTARIFAA